jgi:hypothetical protein
MAMAWAAVVLPSQGFDEFGDAGFADEAEADAGEGDAELADGEVFVDVLVDVAEGGGVADLALFRGR